MSNRRFAALLLGLTLVVYAMIGVRVAYSGNTSDEGLLWNLVLAWIPYVLAVAVYRRFRRGSARAPLVVGGLLWLLFFPNAPYVITDLNYLRDLHGAPLWYETLLTSTAAIAGLALGFASLYLMQAVVRRLAGAVNAWFFVLGALTLSSFGVYLGRFQRWNSWDVLVRPEALLGDLWRAATAPGDHVRAAGLAVLFTAFLAASYLVFYSFARRRKKPA